MRSSPGPLVDDDCRSIFLAANPRSSHHARAFSAVYFLDDLTEKTFLSGYKIKGKESSLLKIIGSGMLCFSDFTSILSKNPTSRGEILGQLRLVYDGNFSKRTGVGEIKWSGKMGFLGAATPDIYHILEASRSMGERYLYYWLEQPTDEEIVKKQETVSMSSREIAEVHAAALQGLYIEGGAGLCRESGRSARASYHGGSTKVSEPCVHVLRIRESHRTPLISKLSKPDALVNKPGVGRDRKMFQTLLHALQIMRASELGMHDAPVTDDMVKIVQKCAWSSVGRERRKVLEILSSYDTALSASQIGATDDFGLQKEGVEKYLHVLHAVGLIQKGKPPGIATSGLSRATLQRSSCAEMSAGQMPPRNLCPNFPRSRRQRTKSY